MEAHILVAFLAYCLNVTLKHRLQAWSKLLRKEIAYTGHADFHGFEAQLRKRGNPSWLAYDLRVMYQGFVERGFGNTEDQAARFAALLGHPPRTYSSFAEDLAREWAVT